MYQEAYNRLITLADEILAKVQAGEPAPSTDVTRGSQATRRRRGLGERLEADTAEPVVRKETQQPSATSEESLDKITEIMYKHLYAAREATPMELYNEEAKVYKDKFVTGRKGEAVPVPPHKPPFDKITFYDLADRYEANGNYDALLANAQDNIFKGKKVSEMTIAELKEFSTGEYAEASKKLKKTYKLGNPNVPSTPMGRYQFVGTTLAQLADEMGLSEMTPFSPRVQDTMFRYYINKRLASADTIEGKRKALRSAWEGFNKASDREIDAAIANVSLMK
jgi:hypothetical protein